MVVCPLFKRVEDFAIVDVGDATFDESCRSIFAERIVDEFRDSLIGADPVTYVLLGAAITGLLVVHTVATSKDGILNPFD